jgi:hypothetical protein
MAIEDWICLFLVLGLALLNFWFGGKVNKWYYNHLIQKPGRISLSLIKEAATNSNNREIRIVRTVYIVYLCCFILVLVFIVYLIIWRRAE